MWSILCITFTFVCLAQSDVAHINSFNAPIHQSYIYKNPHQIVIPRGIPNAYQYNRNLLQQQLQEQPQQIQQMQQFQQLQQPQLQQPQQQLQNFMIKKMDSETKSVVPKSMMSYKKSVNSKLSRRYKPRTKIPKKPIVTKSFYVHSAPEDTEEELREELKQLEERPRKHFNVLFVKPPAQTSKTSAMTLAKALRGDQKTVVYVLSKKTSATDLRDAIEESPQEVNKPEVFFIKYRTPEEAEHAQLNIQKQYAALDGPSTISDEGEAPIASVIGALDPESEEDDEVEDENITTQQMQHTSNNQINLEQGYLPVNRS